ncbi:MAG: efflux RND transporter permease subunit [Candidatus Omnitrophica bacterium]|nr:efflux RND transporter permease subunit [Candidatus Omnitrophota bacterium]
MSLPAFSVRRPITVFMIYLGLMLIGALALTRLPIELYPNFSFGDISIIVDIRGGMPPTEVETLVAKPIEESVATVSHLRDVISISEEGRARIVLTFEPGTDMNFAALEVREKFSRIKSRLPSEIEKPVIAKFSESDRPVLIVAVTGLGLTTEQLRKIVDEQIKDQVTRVSGVANVEVGGGRERKILVEVNAHKLESFGYAIDRVTRLLNASNLNLALGDVERTRDKYLLRAVGEFTSLDEIRQLGLGVAPSGAVVRVRDVAEVKDSFLEATSFSRVNALPVVSLYVQKETTANTVRVTDTVLRQLDQLAPQLPAGIKFVTTYNQATSIKRAIGTVRDALIQGAVLSVLVLAMFLAGTARQRLASGVALATVIALFIVQATTSWLSAAWVTWLLGGLLALLLVAAAWWPGLRLTLIIAAAIPISVLLTFGLMLFQKLTLNIMTLGGLALGIGMLVDNSIVVLDNIVKHVERRATQALAAVRGAQEMLLAIVASTLTTVVVFLPMVFVNQEIRILYSGQALTITYALMASLFVALTLVPLLASRLPPKTFPPHEAMRRAALLLAPSLVGGEETAWWKWRARPLRRRYRRVLAWSLRFRWLVVALLAVSAAGAWWTAEHVLEKEFIGSSEQEDFTVFVELPTGAKLAVSDEAVGKIEKLLGTIPEIKNVSSRIEPWSSKIYVKLVPLVERRRSTKEVIEALRPQVEEIERQFREAFIYFEEQQEVETNEIIVEIYGHDYEILNQMAVELLKRMQAVPGLTDLKIRWRRGRPEWQVKVDKQKAAALGLTVEEIANTLHAQMRGLRATLYHTEAKEIEVVTRLQEQDRATLNQLRKITFTLPNQEPVRLEQVASLVPALGPSKIWRKNKQRMIQISANRGRYPFGTAAQKVYHVIKDTPFPRDYYWRFGENYWRMLRNRQEMAFALGLTVILIYLVLASLFESYSQPLIILTTVPLAAIGAVLALVVTRQAINIGAMMGGLMLGGIVVNNAIILIDEMNRLRRAGALRLARAIVMAGTDRLRPIFMTAMTTILGLLPMALSRTEESNLWTPLAITVIGGMTFSTFLTLLVIPSITMSFNDIETVSRKMISLKIRLWHARQISV